MTAREAKHQAKLMEWQGHVTDCRSSGLTVRQWCKEKEISSKTYYRWEHEVLESASKAVAHTGTPPEVPVFAQLPTPSESRPARQACVAATVRFGMAEIDIYSGADVAIVETLCRSISHVK